MGREHCRFFNGYKPCSKNPICDLNCKDFDSPEQSILIVHLGAMGAVLRSTSLLRSIKRKFPKSYITWLTEDHTKPLLHNNPLIDKILGLNLKDSLILSGLSFDIGFYIDKSAEIAGIQKIAQAKLNFGFTTNPENGAIIPISSTSNELWELGLDNEKKFYQNKKTEISLIAESLELPYKRDEYILNLTEDELALALKRRAEWSENGKKLLIGLNTGTSGALQNKTISYDSWVELINKIYFAPKKLLNFKNFQIVLLGGGKSDHERNDQISKSQSHLNLIQSPTLEGLRDGICSLEAVDIVVTADSLGMHMAIALKKYVIAWFGPTCDHEIDLFHRGIKIKSSLSCSPCWKRDCDRVNPCNQSLDTDLILSSILNYKVRENYFSLSATS